MVRPRSRALVENLGKRILSLYVVSPRLWPFPLSEVFVERLRKQRLLRYAAVRTLLGLIWPTYAEQFLSLNVVSPLSKVFMESLGAQIVSL